jgi:GDPmannose 4,6-dehydratase
MMSKTAIITGARGQDASYLAEILLEKDYTVIGINRRASAQTQANWRIDHLLNNPNYIVELGDITDSGSINRLVSKYNPDEFYNLAAQSFVGASWNEPYHTFIVNGCGVLICLEALRHLAPGCKFYQASTSELFGKVKETPQSEDTPFHPRSPYGVAKCAGYWTTVNYRESYGIHASNGILFNHESPRRGIEFVTRKITDAAAKIKIAGGGSVSLGNLDSKRDWGHARDYMDAAWLMLQQDEPDDYVVSTGETHSIQDLLEVAFSKVGLDWEKHVTQPAYDFKSLIEEMVEEDLKRNR